MDASRLLTAVIHGSSLAQSVSALDAAKTAAAATKKDDYWLGATPEEKARVQSWMQADLSNGMILLADLEKALETSSFLAIPSHETAADIVVYSALAASTLPDDAQKKYPNACRWLNHIQQLVARQTGSPALIKFRTAGLKATMQAEASAPVASGAPLQQPVVVSAAGKKDEKADKKAEKKEDKAQAKEAKKDAPAAAGPGTETAKAASADGEDGKKKNKKDEAKAAAGGEETEPKKKKAVHAPKATEDGGEDDSFVPNQLDVRVGKILTAKQFTEKLYIEEIDVGEDQPRVVCSGLVQYYASADMLTNKMVLVVCNLKPRKMADGESNGMVLAASNADKSVVKLVEVPASAKPGDRVLYLDAPPTPSKFPEPNKVAKKKILESVMAGWVTDAEGRVAWTDKEAGKSFVMTIAGSACTAVDIKNGTVG